MRCALNSVTDVFDSSLDSSRETTLCRPEKNIREIADHLIPNKRFGRGQREEAESRAIMLTTANS